MISGYLHGKTSLSILALSGILLLGACQRHEETPAVATATAEVSAPATPLATTPETASASSSPDEFADTWLVVAALGHTAVYADESNWLGKKFTIAQNELAENDTSCHPDAPFTLSKISLADMKAATAVDQISMDFPGQFSQLDTGNCFYTFYKADDNHLALFADGVLYQLNKQ